MNYDGTEMNYQFSTRNIYLGQSCGLDSTYGEALYAQILSLDCIIQFPQQARSRL